MIQLCYRPTLSPLLLAHLPLRCVLTIPSPVQQFIAHTRVGLKWDVFPERRWTNDTVPYAISDLYRE